MKVIDLLNKIANGEINEDTLIEFDNGYKDYCSVKVFFDRYIMDRENLNCEVEITDEDKKIERIKWESAVGNLKQVNTNTNEIISKINEIIDYLNKGE